MATYDYKSKIFEFSNQIKKLVLQYSEKKEFQHLITLIHQILFYAEQYFIEKELKYRNDKLQKQQILAERQQVINQLQAFANSVNDFKNQLNQMLSFLESWKYELNQNNK